jgi:hypothetical protein
MKISHESPLCLLNESVEYNDYQYILPYFWFRYPSYREFMMWYRNQEDSFIILDNGLFEGETYTVGELIALINEIQPDIFIVPDEWNDATKTHVNAKYWMGLKKSNVLPDKTEVMVVLQGKTFNEIKRLYQLCTDLGYNYYSFNHSSIAYEKSYHKITGGVPIIGNKSIRRFELIHECVVESIIKRGHYIHLLGAIDINEFMYYEKYMPKVISSIDTSSPILRGCHKQKYTYYNSQEKPKGKIEDFFGKDLDEQQRSCIFDNIKHFKKLIN